MSVVEGPIEKTVELNLEYPSVSERYFTKYYFIPKERKKAENCSGSNGTTNEADHSSCVEEDTAEIVSVNVSSESSSPPIQEEKKDRVKYQKTSAKHDSSGHTCVMVHTNKLCLVTLSHQHPILVEKKEVVEVSIICNLCMQYY